MRLKNLLWNGLHQLEHNAHYVTLNIFGKEMHLCSRCTGMGLGIILSLPFVLHLYFNYQFNFELIFIISWIFALFAIADWSSIKTGLRKGNNGIRAVTGFLLGMGIHTYLFLLPTTIFFNSISLWSYGIVFTVVAYVAWCRKYNLSLRNPIAQNVAVLSAMPLAVGNVPCGCSQTGGCCGSCACPGCNTTCCFSPCLICGCTLPLLCFLPTILKWFKGRKKSPKASKAKGGKTR